MNTLNQPWHFLVNPAAGRGRALRAWRRWLPLLQRSLPEVTWAESTAETGLTALAEAAVRSGKTHLVGVGGDGTHHDILNGIVAAGGLSDAVYAPLPLGSGNDWVRTLGTPHRPEDWVKQLLAGKIIAHRVGRLRYTDENSFRTTYFLNVAGFAYDAEVVRRSATSRLKSRLLYPLLTLAYLNDYAAPTVRIDYDGNTWTGPVHTINLGIGRYSGGGMRLVPHAEPTSDTLALTFAERLPVWRILLESWRFYTGTIGAVNGVTVTTAQEVTLTPVSGRLEVEADGEWLGAGRVRAELLSGTLKVITAA